MNKINNEVITKETKSIYTDIKEEIKSSLKSNTYDYISNIEEFLPFLNNEVKSDLEILNSSDINPKIKEYITERVNFLKSLNMPYPYVDETLITYITSAYNEKEMRLLVNKKFIILTTSLKMYNLLVFNGYNFKGINSTKLKDLKETYKKNNKTYKGDDLSCILLDFDLIKENLNEYKELLIKTEEFYNSYDYLINNFDFSIYNEEIETINESIRKLSKI